MKILLLIPAPANISPGQRFRFEHYLALKDHRGIQFITKPFFSSKAWSLLHINNHIAQKSLGILSGFAKRFMLLFTLHQYDFIYVYREAAPVGPPIIEWIIAKMCRKKIIYDFDDAIWVSAASDANPMAAGIKCSWKVKNICRYSFIVSVGNEFLASYAKQYCKDVRIIPTVVNTNSVHNRLKDQNELPFTIGWTGTYTNFPHLEKMIPVVNKLKEKYVFDFIIIANKNPGFNNLKYQLIPWDFKSEITDLLKLNIGIMPLANTEIELGKCAFKAIQYMSLGIPAVVSPVGANCEVVQNNVTGFWADTEKEWYDKLEQLLLDKELRIKMGALSRKCIVENYSVDATENLFFCLFN